MLTILKVSAKKLPNGLTVDTNASDFKILLNEPSDISGTYYSQNQTECAHCAINACQTIVASALERAKNFELKDFCIELEGELDPNQAFNQHKDMLPSFKEIKFVLHYKPNEFSNRCIEFADSNAHLCPVSDCLANGVKLVRRYD